MADSRRATNNESVHARCWMLPLLRRHMMHYIAAALAITFEENGLPLAYITETEDFFDNRHLVASGVLAFTILPDRKVNQTPLIPLTLVREQQDARLNRPHLDEHSNAVLMALGYTRGQVATMENARIAIPITSKQAPLKRSQAEIELSAKLEGSAQSQWYRRRLRRAVQCCPCHP